MIQIVPINAKLDRGGEIDEKKIVLDMHFGNDLIIAGSLPGECDPLANINYTGTHSSSAYTTRHIGSHCCSRAAQYYSWDNQLR
jgi:hypothetical protein